MAVNCCGPPLVYFMAIEDNRIRAKEYYMDQIRKFNRAMQKRGTDEQGEQTEVPGGRR